jgi:hypothetical protein
MLAGRRDTAIGNTQRGKNAARPATVPDDRRHAKLGDIANKDYRGMGAFGGGT